MGSEIHPATIVTVKEFVDHADAARSVLIDKYHDLGFIIPTDEMRTSSGANPISITDIPNWLYRLSESLLIIKTTSIQELELGKEILDSIPDCKVKWNYTEGSVSKTEDLDDLDDSRWYHDNKITYDFGYEGIHTIALFSPSKLETIGGLLFKGNKFISQVTITPVMSTLGSRLFFRTYNLENVDLTSGNIKSIYGACFYETSLTSFTLPNSVENIYGSDTFHSGIRSFVVDYENSNLKRLYNNWVFNIQDRATDAGYIDLPEDIEFYAPNGVQIRNDNVYSWINSGHPLTRCQDTIRFHGSSNYATDVQGISYVIDEEGNPTALLQVPISLTSFTIPDTVKYISIMAFMSCYRGLIDVSLPASIEYISTYFAWFGNMNFHFTSNGSRYKPTANSGLMTYSSLDKVGVSDPDVLIYEPPLTLDTYTFPSTYSSNKDFRGSEIPSSQIINSGSVIQNIEIAKNQPKLKHDSNNGPFLTNPRQSFIVDSDCVNFTLYDGCLYQRSTDGLNPYQVLVGIPKTKTSFTIHPSCKEMWMAVFYRLSITDIDMGDNIEYIDAYNGFGGASMTTLRIGNGLKYFGGHMPINACSNLTTFTIGSDENSSLQTFSSAQLYISCPNLSDIWIYSLKVTTVSSLAITTKSGVDKSIHIHFTNRDGSQSSTLKAFLKAGFSTTTSLINGVKLVDIGW